MKILLFKLKSSLILIQLGYLGIITYNSRICIYWLFVNKYNNKSS